MGCPLSRLVCKGSSPAKHIVKQVVGSKLFHRHPGSCGIALEAFELVRIACNVMQDLPHCLKVCLHHAVLLGQLSYGQVGISSVRRVACELCQVVAGSHKLACKLVRHGSLQELADPHRSLCGLFTRLGAQHVQPVLDLLGVTIHKLLMLLYPTPRLVSKALSESHSYWSKPSSKYRYGAEHTRLKGQAVVYAYRRKHGSRRDLLGLKDELRDVLCSNIVRNRERYKVVVDRYRGPAFRLDLCNNFLHFFTVLGR